MKYLFQPRGSVPGIRVSGVQSERTAIKTIRHIFPFAVSLLLLYLLFLSIDVDRMVSALQEADGILISIAVLLSLSVNIFLGAEKWRRILAAMGCRLPYREVLSIRSGCIPFKILFPLKTSELLKAVYLDRKKKLSFIRSAGSIVMDKTLNLLVVVPMALIGLIFIDAYMVKYLLLMVITLIVLVVYSSVFRRKMVGLATRINPRLHGVVNDLLSGFDLVQTAEKMILIFYSVIYVLLEIVNAYILLKAVGVTAPFAYFMVVIPVIMIINNLPMTILGLGTREIAVVYFFSDFGTPAALFSGGLLISLIEHILPVIIGFFFIRSFWAYFVMKNDKRLAKKKSR